MYLQTGNFENQSRGLSIFARDMKCWGVGNDYSASLHADGRPFRRTRSSTDASGLCPAMKARSSGESPLMSFVSTHFAVSSDASSSLSSFTFAERPPRFDPILRQSIELSSLCRCSGAMHQRYGGYYWVGMVYKPQEQRFTRIQTSEEGSPVQRSAMVVIYHLATPTSRQL
jgi:hypothetical protein